MKKMNPLAIEATRYIQENDLSRDEIEDYINATISDAIDEYEHNRPKDYPDIEADGLTFCGKCHKIK